MDVGLFIVDEGLFSELVKNKENKDVRIQRLLWYALAYANKDADVNTESVVLLRFKALFAVLKENRGAVYSSVAKVLKRAVAAIEMVEEEVG